ncbi:MAG: hypothetical protein GC149_10380 [Gammaproteobacteria bacterium]|nr:hypothetical protein [Gammaproteobacteria bacterium]
MRLSVIIINFILLLNVAVGRDVDVCTEAYKTQSKELKFDCISASNLPNGVRLEQASFYYAKKRNIQPENLWIKRAILDTRNGAKFIAIGGENDDFTFKILKTALLELKDENIDLEGVHIYLYMGPKYIEEAQELFANLEIDLKYIKF